MNDRRKTARALAHFGRLNGPGQIRPNEEKKQEREEEKKEEGWPAWVGPNVFFFVLSSFLFLFLLFELTFEVSFDSKDFRKI